MQLLIYSRHYISEGCWVDLFILLFPLFGRSPKLAHQFMKLATPEDYHTSYLPAGIHLLGSVYIRHLGRARHPRIKNPSEYSRRSSHFESAGTLKMRFFYKFRMDIKKGEATNMAASALSDYVLIKSFI